MLKLWWHFNSIKVRLKLTGFIQLNVAVLIFQFHKGTIKTVAVADTQNSFGHFNSIKVRLKRSMLQYVFIVLHFNSIKVRLKLNYNFPVFRKHIFQFHKGTIKTSKYNKLTTAYVYFNSIKVRLKPGSGKPQSASITRFQFHKGTIKTMQN